VRKFVNVTERRLHLGCGLKAPEGWVNVDGSWNAWLHQHTRLISVLKTVGVVSNQQKSIQWPKNILIWNLRKGLPFSSEHFECVYASHILEHLYHDDAAALLKEAHRVLRTGGIVRIAVPDLRSLVNDYLEEKSSANGKSVAAAHRLQEAMLLRDKNRPRGGILKTIYNSTQDLHTHKWLYDEESLREFMTEAGFTGIRRCGFLESRIEGIQEVEEESRVSFGNLCLEAERP